MRTEEVIGRLFSGGAVLTAVDTDGDRVADALDERYGLSPPTLPGGSPSLEDAETLQEFAAAFSYRKHIEHLAGDLRGAHSHLSSMENRHQRKLMKVKELEEEREELNKHALELFIEARSTIESHFGSKAGFTLANIEGKTPRLPKRLVEQLEQTVEFLRKPEVKPRKSGLKSVKVDLSGMADELEPVLKRLRAVNKAYNRTRKQLQRTVALKKRAIDEFDKIFRWVSRALESLFHLAGEHELAERVRPSVRRRGRRAVDEEAKPPEEEPAEKPAPAKASASRESVSKESVSKESVSETPVSPKSASKESASKESASEASTSPKSASQKSASTKEEPVARKSGSPPSGSASESASASSES